MTPTTVVLLYKRKLDRTKIHDPSLLQLVENKESKTATQILHELQEKRVVDDKGRRTKEPAGRRDSKKQTRKKGANLVGY